MSKNQNNRPSAEAAFTRVDLVTLISVLTCLAVVAVPAFGRVTGKTVIAQCAANLQQYGLALQIYGNENQGLLPSNTQGYWAWDLATPTITYVTNTGVRGTSLFCPGTAARFSESDNRELLAFESPSAGVIGYAGTLPGTASMTTTAAIPSFGTNVNASFTAQRVSYGAFANPIKPSSRVLVADATLTPDTGTVPPIFLTSLRLVEKSYNWVTIPGGYFKNHLSAHLNENIPLGGNTALLDGHVEWQNFTNMLPRAGGNGDPYFYW